MSRLSRSGEVVLFALVAGWIAVLGSSGVSVPVESVPSSGNGTRVILSPILTGTSEEDTHPEGELFAGSTVPCKNLAGSSVWLLIEGILYSPSKGQNYADIVTRWNNALKRQYVEARYHTERGNEFASKLQFLDDSSRVIGEEVPLVIDRLNIRASRPESPPEWQHATGLYSFKQNRLLLKLEVPANASRLRLICDAWITREVEQFRGFLRVQSFNLDPEASSGNSIQFEWYDGSDYTIQIGKRKSFDRELSPGLLGALAMVGWDIPEQRTKRMFQVEPCSDAKFAVEGLFGFSGYDPRSPAEVLDAKDTQKGGGGGFQDAVNRYSHYRGDPLPRPPMYCVDPTLLWTWLPSVLRFDGRLVPLDETGQVLDYKWSQRLSWSHRYDLTVKAGKTGAIIFVVRDDFEDYYKQGVARHWKTFDNTGALVIQQLDHAD